MHQIKTSIRRIALTDLPTVTQADGVTRPATEQELLGVGIFHLVDDFYSCIHQEERDPATLTWRPKEGQSLPGTIISEGTLAERHAKLPADVRARVLHARVSRGQGKQAIVVSMSDVQSGDTVLEQDVYPHSWAGEPR